MVHDELKEENQMHTMYALDCISPSYTSDFEHKV